MLRARLLRLLVTAAGIGAVPLAIAGYARLGSGTACDGIGFGCTPERAFDTALVLVIYIVGVAATTWLATRRSSAWAVAMALIGTLGATGTAIAIQLPDYEYARGDLQHGLRQWESVIDVGRRSAGARTPLSHALAAMKRTGPEPCRDAYGRETGAWRYRWTYPASRYHDPANGTTAPALATWVRELRSRRVPATHEQVSPEDSRLSLGYGGARANGGTLYVRASHYIPELEISVSTGCHRP